MNQPSFADSIALVTVVIPAWNIGEELVGAVESALAQGSRVRTLVVENASDIPLPRCSGEHLVLERRVSVAGARNAGLAKVETPYVMFLDADDRLLEGTVDHLVAVIQASPSLVAACCTPVPWDAAADRPAHRPPYPPNIAYRLCHRRRAFAFANLVRNLLPVTGCTVIRTAAVREAGGFADSNFGEDWALGAMLPFRGEVVLLHRPGSHYAMRDGSLSTGGGWDEIVAARKEIRRRVLRDPAVPFGVRVLLPLIALLQYGSALRRVRYRRPGAAGT